MSKAIKITEKQLNLYLESQNVIIFSSLFFFSRVSRLEIQRVSPQTDGGYYECRATNVVSREPSIARQKVIITQSNKKTHSSPSTTTTRGPLWPQVRPCPIPSFCLNGGTCTLYEAVGEYVCQ